MKEFLTRMNDDLHSWLKQESFEQDKSMAQIVREALEEKKEMTQVVRETLEDRRQK